MAFMTGAMPAPRHKLMDVMPFRARFAPKGQIAYIPKKLSVWGNATYGCCVTSEEAFAKACYDPEIFIPDDVMIAWAQRHGVLNGADLPSVMDAMRTDGFMVGAQQYDDGPSAGVDWSDESTLQSALDIGPVKIGICHSALPSTAGQMQGWYAIGPGPSGPLDHCTSLAGYGAAGWLYEQLKVGVPSDVHPDATAYLEFTWGSIGVVDHWWIMGACGEAYLRSPTTTGNPPLSPTPPVVPPLVPPQPVPTTVWAATAADGQSKVHAAFQKLIAANPRRWQQILTDVDAAVEKILPTL